MFARVITAEAGADGFDGVMRLAREQLPGARQSPGFKGYYVLTDAGTGGYRVAGWRWDRDSGVAGTPAVTTEIRDDSGQRRMAFTLMPDGAR